jgi:hypothetical protein
VQYFKVWRPVSTARRSRDLLLLQAMATDGTYGETLEIMAAAAAFGVSISMHVGQRRYGGCVVQEEIVSHYLCGTVEQRDVWGLPLHVHGQIYLHSTDGQHHFQWKNPAPAPALDPAPPLLLLSPPPALTLPSDWNLTDTGAS